MFDHVSRSFILKHFSSFRWAARMHEYFIFFPSSSYRQRKIKILIVERIVEMMDKGLA
jgi:hypothetical protein